MVLIALTGVPGTGKSTVSAALRDKGLEVVDLNELIKQEGFILGKDEQRDSLDVDLKALGSYVQELDKEVPVILEGHLSHLLPVDLIIVLRAHPDTLRKRLEGRGWSKEKVMENLEAEAMAVISQEASDSGILYYEVDVTNIKVDDIAEVVSVIISGNEDGENFKPGKIDHFQEIMKWY